MGYPMFPSFAGDGCVFGTSAVGDQASNSACRLLFFVEPSPPVFEGGAHVGGLLLFLFASTHLFNVVPQCIVLGTGWQFCISVRGMRLVQCHLTLVVGLDLCGRS